MVPNFLDKSKLPHKPGVYIFKDRTGKILYVGKAIDLYHRVSSYFLALHLKGVKLNLKTITLVEKITEVETVVVSSELEALILEANLIKKYLPLYNIKFTDDKDYLYIKITKEDFPKIITARKKELKDAKKYFGPFPSGNTVRTTLKKLRRIFPWCSSMELRTGKQKACFYHHLGLCPGPCAGKISKIEYNKIINRFSKFMEGKKDEVFEDLNKEMRYYSKKQQFEEALRVRRIIEGLRYLTQTNNTSSYLENPNFLDEQNKLSLEQLKSDLKLPTIPERIECFDISNILGRQAVGSLVVLTFGEIDKKWYRKFKIKIEGKPNDVAMVAEILRRRLKHDEWPKPDLILVDGGKGQVAAAKLEIQNLKLEIPVFGLAKRMEWLYAANFEIIKLPKSSKSLLLLQKIRNEAHRFAIHYHRKLRDKVYAPTLKV